MPECKSEIRRTLGIFSFFLFFMTVNFILGAITFGFLWGMPIGIILGILMCIYLSKSQDFDHMQPNNPGKPYFTRTVSIFAILGVLVANIVLRSFSQEVADFILGCGLMWLFISLGFITFQRCKNKSSSNSN